MSLHRNHLASMSALVTGAAGQPRHVQRPEEGKSACLRTNNADELEEMENIRSIHLEFVLVFGVRYGSKFLFPYGFPDIPPLLI